MRPIWVLVADNSQASMYDFQPHQHELNLLDSIQHEEGRWHSGDFITDKAGNATNMHSQSNVSNNGLGATGRSPKDHENTRFTRQIAKAINHAYDNNSFHTLQVCAPPGFMGELLPNLKKSIPLSHKVTKDLVSADEQQIMQHLNPLTLG